MHVEADLQAGPGRSKDRPLRRCRATLRIWDGTVRRKRVRPKEETL
jgi:hypothetical protein